MNRFIFIIHSSEIIRKGLAAILRNFFNMEIMQMETMSGLNAYRKMKKKAVLIILEDLIYQDLEPLNALRENNQVKFVRFTGRSGLQNATPFECEESINIETTAIGLQDIISKCLKNVEKISGNNENDELTIREKEVLRLVALGHSNKIIADKLFISIHTVISHRKNISEKTGIKSISGLTVYAILNNLIDTNSINPADLI